MRSEPPEQAIAAMFLLTALAVGLVMAIEAFTKFFK
jgi:hypothetical protein